MLAALLALAAASVPDCTAAPGRAALAIAGTLARGEAFARPAGPGWVFALDPAPEGWIVRLRAPDGRDLAAITPPYHFVPNPRELYGWHFRNRANTGPNDGDVNAPQARRDVIFDLGEGADPPDAARVAAAEGRGVLLITGFTLSPPEPGTLAYFSRLSFEACLTWPEAWQ